MDPFLHPESIDVLDTMHCGSCQEEPRKWGGGGLEGRHPEADLSWMLEIFIYGIYMAYIWPGSATGAFPDVLRPSPGPPDDRWLPRVRLSSEIEPRATAATRRQALCRLSTLAPSACESARKAWPARGSISGPRWSLGSHRSSGGSGEGRRTSGKPPGPLTGHI